MSQPPRRPLRLTMRAPKPKPRSSRQRPRFRNCRQEDRASECEGTISLRIDQDVLEYFQEGGPGCRTGSTRR